MRCPYWSYPLGLPSVTARVQRATSSERRLLMNKWLTRCVPTLAALTLTIASSAIDTALPSPADMWPWNPSPSRTPPSWKGCSLKRASPARRVARTPTSTETSPCRPAAARLTIRIHASKEVAVTFIRSARKDHGGGSGPDRLPEGQHSNPVGVAGRALPAHRTSQPGTSSASANRVQRENRCQLSYSYHLVEAGVLGRVAITANGSVRYQTFRARLEAATAR